MGMKIVVAYPPMYNQIAAKFEVGPRTIFAWHDRIYNPGGGRITNDLIAHEEVHMVQQNGMPATWWRRYLDEAGFRLSQEIEAYGRQYQYICSRNPNRNFQFQVLQALSLHLAGPMYGRMTSLDEAMKSIKESNGIATYVNLRTL